MAKGTASLHDHHSSQWTRTVDHPIQGRLSKPRERGITMVLDKGLGIAATADVLNSAAKHIDFWKLSFGTSVFYPQEVLHQKTDLIRDSGIDVYPGGTLLEVAVLQGRLERFLTDARNVGFTFIEVSDGTIEMSKAQRADTIAQALDAGFRVVTEVGKKDPGQQLDREEVVEQIESDLAQGVYKVIIEGRESGRGVGVYNPQGELDEAELGAVMEGIRNPNRLIFEAPLKNQQSAFITLFGPNVNLGNVSPSDAIALEALRVGLRGDTLKEYLIRRVQGSAIVDYDVDAHPLNGEPLKADD